MNKREKKIEKRRTKVMTKRGERESMWEKREKGDENEKRKLSVALQHLFKLFFQDLRSARSYV